MDAVRCTSGLAAKFVAQLKEKTAGTNTKIVVMSDHLAHHNNVYDTLEKYERRNTVILLQDELPPTVIGRAGSMIDVFPTVLDWMGWLPADDSRAGLGVSLLRHNETLVERFGIEEVNKRLGVDIELAKTLWNGVVEGGV